MEVFGPLEAPLLVGVAVWLGVFVFEGEGLGLVVVVPFVAGEAVEVAGFVDGGGGGGGGGLEVVVFSGFGGELFPPRPPPRCGLAEATSTIISTARVVRWERNLILCIT